MPPADPTHTPLTESVNLQADGSDELGWLCDVMRDRANGDRSKLGGMCPSAIKRAHARLARERADLAAARGELRASMEAHEHADFIAELAQHELEQSRAWESGWKARALEAESELERVRAGAVCRVCRLSPCSEFCSAQFFAATEPTP